MGNTTNKNRIMIVSRNVPPRYSGTSVVIENLSKGFSIEELLVVGEKLLGLKNEVSNDFRQKLKYNTISFKTNRILTGILRKIQIINGLIILLYQTVKFKPGKIIIIYPSAEYLLMGYLLSKLYTCDYYSYFHNTYLENRVGYKKNIAQWLQNNIFKLSKFIFLISDGMFEYYTKEYSAYAEKFITLTHSFTEDIPENVDVRIEGKVKLAFAGNINESCRDAAERMLKALSKFENVEFHIFSSGIDEGFFMKLGISRHSLFCYPTMKRTEFLYCLRQCDIMLLPHGFIGPLPQIEYNTIFPTKTIEYLISGKPIFYHGSSDAFLTKFLKKSNCAEIVTLNKEIEIKNEFYNLINNKFRREFLVKNSLIKAKTYEIDNVINIFKSHLK